jgi:hypothetical protein
MLKNYSPLTIFGWTLLIIYLSFHLVTLTKIQDVYGDEPADMQTAWTLLKTGQVGSYSGRDVLSPSFRFLTNAFPYHLRPFVSHYYGLFIRLFGLSLTTARFTSWCSIALGMVILYALSLRLFGPLGGLASLTLLLADPILGTCIHICREEAPLFAATVLVLSLWHWAFTRESFWLGFLAGCGASLSSGIHPNGILLIPALGAMALVAHRSSAGWNRTAGGGALGAACGLTLWAIACPWDEFLLGWKIWGGYWGYRLPILSGQPLLSCLASEMNRYFFPLVIPQSVPSTYFGGALRLEYAVVAASLGVAFWKARKERIDACLLTGLLTLIVGMSLIVARKYAGYTLLVLPWMSLLVGRAAANLNEAMGRGIAQLKTWVWRGGLAVIGGGAIFLGTNAVMAQAANPLPYLQTCRDLSHWIPIGSKVLGPGQFWLELKNRDWRDSNFLIFEKWMTNSSRHLGPAIDRIRPDYLVADYALIRLLATTGPNDFPHQLALVGRVKDQDPKKELIVLKVRYSIPAQTGNNARLAGKSL